MAIIAGKGRATDTKEVGTGNDGPNTDPGEIAQKAGRGKPKAATRVNPRVGRVLLEQGTESDMPS